MAACQLTAADRNLIFVAVIDGAQRGIGVRNLLVGLLVLGAATAAEAAPAPDVVGKSVTVTWSEARQQRINNAPEMRSVTVSFDLGVYVSSTGRPFIRLSSQGNRGTASVNEQVGGSGESLGGGVRTVQVSGRTLTLQASYGNFARSLRVEMAPGGGSCSAAMSIGKQTGSKPTAFRNAAGMIIEIHSVSVSSISCQMREGNVFAR